MRHKNGSSGAAGVLLAADPAWLADAAGHPKSPL
jgi:hypothetical protein